MQVPDDSKVSASPLLVKLWNEQAHPTWKTALAGNKTFNKYLGLASRMIVAEEGRGERICPLREHIFRVFSTDPATIRVLALGQDPYHTWRTDTDPHGPAADGMAFSCPPPAQSSMLNIMKELENEGFERDRSKTRLDDWRDQGVLLLNVSLTVSAGKADSHAVAYGRGLFAREVLKTLKTLCPDLVVMAWGGKAVDALSKAGITGDRVIATSHPSGMSAYKDSKAGPAFLGSGVFKAVNDLLGPEKSIHW